MTLTTDMTKLWKEWVKIYVNIMLLKSKNPIMRKKLDELQNAAAEFNGLFTEFPGVNP